MKYINVPTTNGNIMERVYTINDFPYNELKNIPTCSNKKNIYYNCSSAFDIESTTIKPKEVDGKYIENPYAFMYHWQFCINNKVVFGRRWEEFTCFLRRLKRAMGITKHYRLCIYVHFLSYEFQFMKEFINIDTMFSKDKRKPMKIITKEGFEFRCSYFLSNMSLNKFCQNSEGCTHYKLADEYDYSIVRTADTKLSEIEQAYCYNDVRGLCECIDDKLKHDTIATIPLTSTGYVRREYRTAMRKNKNNRRIFEKTKLNSDEYTLLKNAFRGGNTHANRFKANVVLKNVYSYDITSSYPSSIQLNQFPVGKFAPVNLNTQKKLDYFINNYCCVLDVSFYKIQTTEYVPYIDIAHCIERKNILNDNGRVLKADFIRLCLTEIDLNIIRETYSYEGLVVNKAEYSEKGKLPKELRTKMMQYYDGKTQLKGIPEKSYEYLKSKNMINATFGMMVTDIAHSEVEYNTETMEWTELKPNLDTALEKFYRSRNNFLSYQWGVWVTANSRARLQLMINKVGKDLIYIDTDSIKFINKKHIKEFEELNNKLLYDAENNDIRAYSEKDGKRYHLGVWDNDGAYDEFKTLGAKKYAYNTDGEFHITVSGMNKKKGAIAVGSINNFKIGTTFNDVGRTVSWYNDVKQHKINVNGCVFLTASNIGVLETTYTLGVTNEYWSLIEKNLTYID